MQVEQYSGNPPLATPPEAQIVAVECNAIDQDPYLVRVYLSAGNVGRWAGAGFVDFGAAWPKLFEAGAAHGFDHAMIQQAIATGGAFGRTHPIRLDDVERRRLVEAAKRGRVTYREAATDRARALMVPVFANLAKVAKIADEIDGSNRTALLDALAPSVIHGRRAYRADDDAGACEAWALH